VSTIDGAEKLKPLSTLLNDMQDTSVAVTSIILIVAGIGVGPNFNSLLIPIHASFDERSQDSDIALSASAYAFFRAIGSSLGISVSGLTCFSVLAQSGDSTLVKESVAQAIISLRGLTGAAKDETVAAFQKAMQSVFIEITVFMAAGFLMSLMIARHQLGDKVRTEQKVGARGEVSSTVPDSESA
jgi:hypothetical protein